MVLLQRSSLLLLLLVSVAYAYLVIPVHAQTITVSNLQYPSTVILGGQVTVSFTVSWSGAPYGTDYWFYAGVVNSAANLWASGTLVSSSPNICDVNTDNHWADCYFQSPQTDGSVTVTFSVDSPPTGTHSYFGAADIDLYSPNTCTGNNGFCTEVSGVSNTFDITVVNQFTLTVNVPYQVTITLDGIKEPSEGSIAPQLSPGTHSITVPDIVQLDKTSRLVFVGWSDGSNQTTRTFDLESDTEITGNYVTQYYVSSTADSTLQSGWHNSGSTVQVSVNQSPWNSYRVLVGGFDGWYSNGQLISKSPSSSIQINGPLSLSARWNYMPYLPPLLVVVMVGAILSLSKSGILPELKFQKLKIPKLKTPKRSSRRTRRSKPKTDALTPEVEESAAVSQTTETTTQIKAERTVAPAKTTMYCTKCGAVIPRESKFCRECGAKQQTD